MNREPPISSTIWLARPRGFCAGVCRALDTVEAVLARFGAPIYVNHEIVHNGYVVEDLRQRGVVFIRDLTEVPPGRPLIFSAHGVAAKLAAAAKARGLMVVDATCPLVEKVHRKARRAERAGRTVILIGHRDHPEVVGTLGQVAGPAYLVQTAAEVAELPDLPGEKITVLTQTTLTPDEVDAILAALVRRFPKLTIGDDICYATRNRQKAVRLLAERCPVILVVGSGHSSNSRRLVEAAHHAGAIAHLIETVKDVRAEWLEPSSAIGITAAASAPECLVEALVARLRQSGWTEVRELPGESETITFALPRLPGATAKVAGGR